MKASKMYFFKGLKFYNVKNSKQLHFNFLLINFHIPNIFQISAFPFSARWIILLSTQPT